MSAKRGNPEARLSIVCKQYLETVLPPAAAATLAHIPNEGKRGPATIRLMKAMGLRAGVEDYQFVHEGILHAIEIKCEGEYQRPTQKEREQALIAAGARYAVCRSTEDVAEILADWRIPTRDVSLRFARPQEASA